MTPLHGDLSVHGNYDAQLLNVIFRDPEIFVPSSEDFGVRPEDIDFSQPQNNMCVCIVCSGEKLVGYISFNRLGLTHYEMHAGFKDSWRGSFAKEAVSIAIEGMFRAGTKRLTINVPRFNRGAQRLAGAIGFKREGVLREAFLKNGTLHDLIVYGLLVKEWRFPCLE
jgi:RimJ/RimL family protein N-acetyltransferase